MSASYDIPAEETRVEYFQGNSRFLATIASTPSLEDAKSFLSRIRAEMPDATHHVYAYIIGYGASVTEGMSDDGEPSGTSGPPALAVLRGSGLGDVALVITRYFGGTKLGTGGLVTAYKSAAKLAVGQVPREKKILRVAASTEVAYPHYERLKTFLLQHNALLEHEEFTDDVALRFLIPQQSLAELRLFLQDLTNGKGNLQLDP